VYGAINPDLVHFVDRLPGRGDDIRSSSWHFTWGGKATNAAVALAGWEVDTRLLGLVLGDDALGNALLASLDIPSLDRSWITTDAEARTRHCIILLTPDGDRTIVCAGYEGARWQQVPDEAWDGVAVVLIDGFGAAGAAATTHEAIRRAVPTIWLDAPGDCPIGVDLVVWSRHEHDPDDAGRLAQRGIDVALTAGSSPITVWSHGNRFEVVPPAVDAANSTGAGDVFAAGCALGLASGWAIRDTVTWATAAGAAAASSGRSTMPSRADVEALISR